MARLSGRVSLLSGGVPRAALLAPLLALQAAPLAPLAAAPARPQALAAPAPERPNGVLLVARPGLPDPNFSRTVLLVTRSPDGGALGVILNRPLGAGLAARVDPELPIGRYHDRLYFGGPVRPERLVAVFRADAPPAAAAYRVRERLYLSWARKNVERLLADPGTRYRLYAGYAGWAPRQLEHEIDAAAWFVLPVDEAVVLRPDTAGLWKELVARATGARARAGCTMRKPRRSGARCPDGPGGTAVAAHSERGRSHTLERRVTPSPSLRRF